MLKTRGLILSLRMQSSLTGTLFVIYLLLFVVVVGLIFHNFFFQKCIFCASSWNSSKILTPGETHQSWVPAVLPGGWKLLRCSSSRGNGGTRRRDLYCIHLREERDRDRDLGLRWGVDGKGGVLWVHVVKSLKGCIISVLQIMC